MKQTKKSYAAPKLIVHGNVEQVTQKVRAVLSALDADFPTGTPFSDLTFS